MRPLPHHTRYAAWLMVRRPDMVFEEAPRFRTEIAGPYVGPCAALSFAIAGRLAGFACRLRRHLEIAIVTADTVDGKLPRAMARLDDAGAADPGRGASIFHPGRHLALEPARSRTIGSRVAETPRPAAAFPVAPSGACGGITGTHREARVVAAPTIKSHLRAGRRRKVQDGSNRQRQRNKCSNHLA